MGRVDETRGSFPGSVEPSELPEILERLSKGAWPGDATAERAQHLRSAVAPDRVVELTHGDQDHLCLKAPPFLRLSAMAESNPWWYECGALRHFDPAGAVVLGDFGLGSDAVFVVELQPGSTPGRVLRMRWHARGPEWVEWFSSLGRLVTELGLGADLEGARRESHGG